MEKNNLKMLEIKKIHKVYQAGNEKVHALKDINLVFRKNEFVSILGPSGSGKTTLLNIIGGLDKYTSGDLIIAGKSTKNFKNRDWDKYRNLRIGFIFQAYNLIPHQNIVSNVELALTISGVKKKERRQKAIKALEKVGLGNQLHKKPNQLSGGQCQRVAIARALVNDPEILLADEPTGALDTKTSEQIMNLIKEIADERLVIMVTHNPDLAERFSTRIINLKDGQITEDTNPFNDGIKMEEDDKVSKAKMGIITAIKLSFKNLISKLRRTILIAVACSIGIIGVSTVLALSCGITDYIDSMQDDMLSSYPITISEETLDIASLTNGLSNFDSKIVSKFDPTTQVGMDSMINYLMEKYGDISNLKTNDINDTLITYLDEMPKDYTSSIKYDYGIDVTNNIFCNWESSKYEGNKNKIMSLNGLTQRYIAELQTVKGFEKYAAFVNLFSNFMKQLPGDDEYITSQYDLLGNSTFAKDENEIMLVVDKNTTMTDLILGQMGYYDHDAFINIGKKAVRLNELNLKLKNKEITQEEYDIQKAILDKKYPYKSIFNYDELIGSEFYYIPSKALWEYGNVSTDTSMAGTILMTDTINGTICYLTYSKLDAYGYDMDILSGMLIKKNMPTQDVTFIRTPSSKNRDPFTFADGQWIYLPNGLTGDMSEIDLDKYLTIATISGKKSAGIHINKGEYITFDNVYQDFKESDMVNGYNYSVEPKQEWLDNPEKYGVVKMKVSGILRAKNTTNFGSISRGVYYTKNLTDKFIKDAMDEENDIINDETKGFKSFFKNQYSYQYVFGAYVTFNYCDFSSDIDNNATMKKGYAFAINSSGTSGIGSIISSFTGGLSLNNYHDTNISYLRALSGLREKEKVNDDEIIYSFEKLPQNISIYPRNFEAKDKVTSYLDRWNSNDTLIIGGNPVSKEQRSDLNYTDTVAIIIYVINTLVTIITIALVAFTSLSLIVSCFMIAVITYISVMERVKEIGVIRSLGGRKRDVRRLFTAENVMTGLASGVIGISITYLLSLIINLVIKSYKVPPIAALPWYLALLMIVIAVLLNVLSGMIPSSNAAKQDPVNALRSE